jgi:hypothetical protein
LQNSKTKEDMQYEYQFPEKIPFRAKEVTEPEFHIQSREDWFKKLWVDFSGVRSQTQFDSMQFDLGMVGNRLENIPNDYVKIIFSGHRGCGKSVELKRFSTVINSPDAFFAILVDLEKETNVEQLEPEDIFIVLITLLARELEERKIKIDQDDFADISNEWLEEKEVVREVSKEFGVEGEAKVTLGWNFWKFLGLEGNLKGAYTRNNVTTNTIRQKIKTNPKPLLQKFNTTLTRVRRFIREQKRGKDIIFIIDGLEKANPAVYESLFVKDVQMITGINAHLISTVPIGTFYEIKHLPTHDFFRDSILPMVRDDEKSRPLLKKLVELRVDKNIFEAGVQDIFIEASGGCPRILLKLVNRSIVKARGSKVTKAIAHETLTEEGNDRWRTLNSKHKEILHNGQFDSADKEVLELLQSLNLLEYNGMKIERKINPLIRHFLPNES